MSKSALADAPAESVLVDVAPVPSLRAALALAQRLGAAPGTSRAVLRHYEDGHAVVQLQGIAGDSAVQAAKLAAGSAAVEACVVSSVAEVAGERPVAPELAAPRPLSPPLMETDLEQAVRAALASETFGVLVTLDEEHLHTATVLFAEAPDWRIVIAARAHTRKARMAVKGVRAAFHVDTRGVAATERQSFTRIGFEGHIRRLPRGGVTFEMYRRMYVEKLPLGKFLLTDPDIYLHLFEPTTMRVAVGGRRPVDVALADLTA
jgi:hypothetical protein